MTMFSFPHYGKAMTFQKITAAADTCYAIDEAVYKIKNKKLKIDHAGTYVIAAGDIIFGNTSSAYGIVTEVGALTGAGTWAGGDAACTLYLFNVIGTFQDNETIKLIKAADGAAVADAAAADGICEASTYAPSGFPEGMQAKMVMVSILTNAANISWNGTAPTMATHAVIADLGHYLSAAGYASITIPDYDNIKNTKIVNAATTANFVAKITGYF